MKFEDGVIAVVLLILGILIGTAIRNEIIHPCIEYKKEWRNAWVQMIHSGKGSIIPIHHPAGYHDVCTKRKGL